MSLHNAARDGNLEELKKLIADGKDLNARDKHQRTALVMASWAGKVDCVKALLDAKAGVKVFAMDDMNAMHFAAQKGHAEVVRLLLNNGIHVNSKTRKGTNALQFAAKQGHLSVVELLLKRHANVAAADRKGNTALDLAQDDSVRAALQAALQEAKGHQKAEAPAKEAKDAEGGAAAAHDAAETRGEQTGAAAEDATEGEPSGVPQSAVHPARTQKRNVRKREDEADGEEPPGDSQPAKRSQKVTLSYLDGEEEEEDEEE